MANGQNFVSWVKVNLPDLYDKNINYNSDTEIQLLLAKVRNYYHKKSNESNIAYQDVASAAADKTAKITAFDNFFAEHKDDSNLMSTIDTYVLNGTITNVLQSLQFLNDVIFTFNL